MPMPMPMPTTPAAAPREFVADAQATATPTYTHDVVIPAWLKADAVLPPTKPLLVGLIGRAGAGKSTVASMLCDSYAFTELALADPIVNMIGSLLANAGIDGAWMTERALKELPTPLGVSYREMAQSLGTEWGRNLRPGFWLRVLAQRLAGLELQGENIVVSDVRFPDEADFITARGGVLVRVLREQTGPVRDHVSESHVGSLPAAYELLNYGSLATLGDQVEKLIQRLRAGS